MPSGRVKFVHADGYGFIVPDDGGQDIFFHTSYLPGGIPNRHDAVTFTLNRDRRGRPIALDVKVTQPEGVEQTRMAEVKAGPRIRRVVPVGQGP